MSRLYVGIDPGLSGAVAVIDEKKNVIGCWDTPVIEVKKGKKKHREYVITEMASILSALLVEDKKACFDVQVAGLEHVHAMPKQGVHSMFQMGMGLGVWMGIVAALGLPMEQVTPQAWKKSMMGVGIGNDKGASIVQAVRLFPKASNLLSRKKDHGRAEALLIAEYFRRKYESHKEG